MVFCSALGLLDSLNILSEDKYCKKFSSFEDAKRKMNTSVSEASKLLNQLDNNLIEIADKIEEDDLYIEKKQIKIYNGRVLDMTIWKYFLQYITHQIHHQGQLSKILDELKIEHEFGNIFPLIPDSL